jgi:hypothetical protein
MANQIMTAGTEAAVLVPEVWSQRFKEVNRAQLPFLDSVSRDYEGEISDMGDTVKISQVPDFSQASLLAEGASGDAEAITVTQQSLVINQRPYKDFIVTKRAQLQSIPFMDKLRESAVYSIQKKMQALIIDAIVPSAATPDHQIAYDSGSTLALADILEAKELLMGANGPAGDQLEHQMVVSEAQWNDLYNITGFTSRDFVPAGSPLASGEFAVPLAGFRPRFTSVASNVTYLFHPSFLTLAVQENLNIEVVGMGAEGHRSTRLNVDLLMGVLQLDDQRVVTIS